MPWPRSASCFGQAWAASEENGLAGLIGPQAGAYRPLNTTWLSAARSMLSSNAWRTRASVASGLAYGAASVPAGLPTPLTLPTLMVMPWYPMESETSRVSLASPLSALMSLVETASSTSTSPDFRLLNRVVESAMIR